MTAIAACSTGSLAHRRTFNRARVTAEVVDPDKKGDKVKFKEVAATAQ